LKSKTPKSKFLFISRDDPNARFTFNFRKDSKVTDISDVSFKEKYEQVYDTYLNNISSTPGYKNRSNAIKAIMNFGQAQNSFSYNVNYDQMPPILRNDPSRRESVNQSKSVKVKKGPGYRKKGPIILQRKDISK
jgi:hypothetical protein